MSYLLKAMSWGSRLGHTFLGHDLEHRASAYTMYDGLERKQLLDRIRTLKDPLHVDTLARRHQTDIINLYRRTRCDSLRVCLLELSLALQDNSHYQDWLEQRQRRQE